MPSPQLNLRVPQEHHAILKAVAARLRDDVGFADHLAALLAGVAAPVAAPVADASSLASVMSRLEALEALKDRVEALELRMRQESAGTVAERDGSVMAVGEVLEPSEASGGPQTRRKWTPEDDAALQAIAARGGTQADAGQELGRPSSVINAKWKALGLPVPPRKGRKLTRRQPP
jgi:hypothetical protein